MKTLDQILISIGVLVIVILMIVAIFSSKGGIAVLLGVVLGILYLILEK